MPISVQINVFHHALINSLSSAIEPIKTTKFSIFIPKIWIQVIIRNMMRILVVLEKLLEYSKFHDQGFFLCREKLETLLFMKKNSVQVLFFKLSIRFPNIPCRLCHLPGSSLCLLFQASISIRRLKKRTSKILNSEIWIQVMEFR